ncbi:dihydrodipicolinate synthase family protein [Vibrio europaeus]|uniref:hypothetical protein n=1 Tax=Vibrio europaeus TaxID=300876 RepID=UPI00233F1775|nr:hypothetical protein [Vibrio europaeus]MDC5822174.1 dihydrodipicolinate synthase family protein [Vibrio europaeus]
MKREIESSRASLNSAKQKNFAGGSSIPSIGSNSVQEAPKPSVQERLAAQRKANIEANDKAFETVQAETPKISAQNMYWPPYNPLAPEGEKHIEVDYIKPITSIAVLSLEEAQEFYENLGGKTTTGNVKDYGLLAKGGAEAYATAKGLGGLGVTASTKNINGKDWVIIREFRRHQQTLMKGNKWGANNPKVIQAGLGLNDLKGAVRYVKFNAGIEVAFAVGINAADFILRDDATLAEFVGNSAGDLAKGFVSLAGAALFTAAFLPTATVLVTGGVFALVSFSIGQALNIVDENNGYSEKLTEATRKMFSD